MDNILQFLIIAGILVIGIYKQYNKEKAKNAENERHAPIPEYDPECETEYETEAPVVRQIPKKRNSQKQKQAPLPTEGARTTYSSRLHNSSDIAAAPLIVEEEEVESEFSIHSAEEARRAVIWSEILQRKYE